MHDEQENVLNTIARVRVSQIARDVYINIADEVRASDRALRECFGNKEGNNARLSVLSTTIPTLCDLPQGRPELLVPRGMTTSPTLAPSVLIRECLKVSHHCLTEVQSLHEPRHLVPVLCYRTTQEPQLSSDP